MPRIRVRKGQGDVKLSRVDFTRRLREHFYDPVFEALQPELDRITDAAWQAYDQYPQEPADATRGTGLRRSRRATTGRMARRASSESTGRASTEEPARTGQSAADCRGGASATRPVLARCRRHSGWRARTQAVGARQAIRGRSPRSQPPHRGVRPPDPPVQGLRLNRDAAVPLAVLLLSQPRARPGRTTG